MRLLLRRPALVFFPVFLIFTALFSGGMKYRTAVLYLSAVLSLALILAPVFLGKIRAFVSDRRKRILISTLAFTLALFAAASVSSLWYTQKYEKSAEHFGKTERITAVVTSVRYKASYSASYVVKITEADSDNVSLKAILNAEYGLDLDEYDRVVLDVCFSEIPEYENGFRMRSYCYSRNITLIADAAGEDYSLSGEEKDSPGYFFFSLFSYCRSAFDRYLGKDASSLARAVFAGDRSALSDSANRDFKELGVYHLLAVSGLHLSVLMGGIYRLLIFLKIRKTVRVIVAVASAFAYAALCGMPFSVIRSAIMLSLFYLSFLLRRQHSSPSSLFAAVSAICAVNPAAIFDGGLLLSFSSTLGIVIFAPKFSAFMSRITLKVKHKSVVRYILGAFAITFFATVFTIPASMFYVDRFSLAAPLFTVILSPLISLILFSAPLLVIFSPVAPLASVFAFLLEKISSAVFAITGSSASAEGISVSLKYDFIPYIILAFVAVSLVLFLIRPEKLCPILIAFALSFCACAAGIAIEKNRLEKSDIALPFNVGKNDGVVFVSRGKSMLCDFSAGYMTIGEEGYSLLSQEYGFCDIDSYLITHYHIPSVSSFSKLSSEIFVRQLILPLPSDEKEKAIFDSLCRCAGENRCEICVFDPGKEDILFGDISISLSDRTYIAKSSHPVLALKAQYGDCDFAYIGSNFTSSPDSDFILSSFERYDYVFLGVHGPKCSDSFTLPETGAEMIVSNKSVFDASDLNSAAVITDGYIELIME